MDPLLKVFGKSPEGSVLRENSFIKTRLDAGLITEETFQKLKEQIEADGIPIEYLVTTGRQAILLKVKGVETGLLRLEADQGTSPLDHPLVLKPILRKKYTTQDAFGGNEDYTVSLVPMTYGIGRHEDYLRTYANFKREKLDTHFVDVDVTQVSYLKDDKGETIRYKDGRPIAFFHDTNSAASVEPKHVGGMGQFEHSVNAALTHIRAELGEIPGEKSTLSEEARQKIHDDMMANMRKKSDKGQEIADETEFLKYMKGLYEKLPSGSEEDILAAKQQSIALARLRSEASKLSLSSDLKDQLESRSAWEAPSTHIEEAVGIQVTGPKAHRTVA